MTFNNMPDRSPARPARRPSRAPAAPRSTPAADPRAAAAAGSGPDDRFFRHIVGGMRNGVIAFHRDGRLALMNDEAYRIFGLTRSPGDLGRPFADVLRVRPAVIRVLSSAFELSHLPNRAELRLRDLDRVIGYTLSQVKDDNGTPVGAAMFFKDLTRVEQLEERERLRDRLASLGEMAAGIAHELKNPLAGIEVMAGLLRRQVPDSPDSLSLLADIMSEAKLANAIVVEMLEFVRPVRLQVEQTDIGLVLQQAETMAESKAARGDVTVTVTLGEDLPAIDGDQHQLSQVFTNLLANAFEALDGRGHIVISAVSGSIEDDPALSGPTPPTPTVVVDVADDGPGFSTDLADKIFNPFFTTKPQGSGLGLAIVRKIVDAHDGRIDVSSILGAGTRFRVTLPVSSTSGWFK
jgi:signal transduction histidine kinase